MTKIGALVLAGSRLGAADPMALAAGVSHKALIPVGGRAMILRVVDALRESGRVGRIAVSIESATALRDVTADLGDEIVVLPAAEGPSKSVAQALDRLGTPLLVTTADHALLRPEWVAYFLDHLPKGADVAVALARRETILAALPDTQRTYLRFSDGAYSGCNLFHLATPEARRAVELWQQLEVLRKEPLRMMRVLGLGVLLRYATRTLPLAMALGHLGKKTALTLGAVEMPDGLAAVDVDKPQDLEIAERVLAQR